ncbi:tail fiber domain-containing protein [Franconibacter pulveris 1160]
MIYSTGTISLNGNVATGNGSNWTDSAAQVRAGQTLIVLSTPVQIFQISAVNSATQLTVTPAASTAVSGQRYGILVSDAMSIDGLAQSMSQLIQEYDENIGAWEAFALTAAAQDITVTINGQNVTIPSLGKLKSGIDSKADKTALDGKADKVNGAVPVNQGGTGATTADAAWTNLAKYGSVANTAAQGNDSRLNTVDGKSGGTISSAVTVNSSITSKTGNGFAVAAGESNRVELNNALTSGATGNPVGWTVYRWYNELVQTGIRRAADTTIQSYFIALSAVGSFEFLRSGTATAPGTWQNGSDERHKTNIKLVQNPLAAVLSLRGVTYDKKDGTSEVGLIAQDAEKFCHEAVSTNGDRKFMDGTVIPAFKYLNTSGLAAAYHTEAIKDIFELLYQIAEDPAAALKTMDAIREQAEQIKAQPVEQAAPWKEEPPVFDVPSVPDSVAESEPVGQQAQDPGEENQ